MSTPGTIMSTPQACSLFPEPTLAGERIMKLAEELYQAGFISYPRTETDIFTPDMDLQVGTPDR